MNSEKYVTRAEFELNEMFDPTQILAITAGNDGRLFRIAYDREVPLLLKVPPFVYAFVTLRKELQSILMLQTYKLQYQMKNCVKSCYLGSYGDVVLYLFIEVRNGELLVWQIAARSHLHLFDEYTVNMLDAVPYSALRQGIAQIPNSWKQCLAKANTSMADANNTGIKFVGRSTDILSVCFITNLFLHTESYADAGEKPTTESDTVHWLGYNIKKVAKCKLPGLDGFGYVSTGTSISAILAVSGSTSIFKGAREYSGINIGSRNTNSEDFDKLVKLLDDSTGISKLLPAGYLTVSYDVFADVCTYLMCSLLKSDRS